MKFVDTNLWLNNDKLILIGRIVVTIDLVLLILGRLHIFRICGNTLNILLIKVEVNGTIWYRWRKLNRITLKDDLEHDLNKGLLPLINFTLFRHKKFRKLRNSSENQEKQRNEERI